MNNNLAIYVHWPFCLSKCPYCDFNSHVAKVDDHNIWLESYKKELDYFASIITGKYISSIFFGGGTPSLMQPNTVAGIINKISQLGKIDAQTEITLEANPTSFEVKKFTQFRQSGINRVSIGVQSLDNDALAALGRNHDSNQAIDAIESANKIFTRVSFDLIYTRAGQSLAQWQDELTKAIRFASGHISLYQLTIEKGTIFYNLHKDRKLILPDQDTAADMYEWTNDYLTSKNYNRYEISNYAQQEQESRHNLTYWNYQEYLGIGPGAHSRIRNFNARCNNYNIQGNSSLNQSISRLMMTHKPNNWLNLVSEKGCGIQIDIELTFDEIIEEFFMMGFRLAQGVSLRNLKNITNKDISEFLDFEKLRYFSDLGFLVINEDRIFLTAKGLILYNFIVPRLLVSR